MPGFLGDLCGHLCPVHDFNQGSLACFYATSGTQHLSLGVKLILCVSLFFSLLCLRMFLEVRFFVLFIFFTSCSSSLRPQSRGKLTFFFGSKAVDTSEFLEAKLGPYISPEAKSSKG